MRDRVVAMILIGIVVVLAVVAIFIFIENGMKAQGSEQEYHEVTLAPGTIIVAGVDISMEYKGDCSLINSILNWEKEESNELLFNDCIFINASSNCHCGY